MKKIILLVFLFSIAVFSLALEGAWTTKRMTKNSGNSMSPAIAVSGSNVYVVWSDDSSGEDSEIYFKRSIDNGASWGAIMRLTSNSGYSDLPVIAASGSNVYVAWQDTSPGNWEIYFKRSIDSGASWGANKRLTNNSGYSGTPAIAASGSNVYVVWGDDSPGNWEIFFERSTDSGASWDAKKRLTNNSGRSELPSIAVNGSNVYVAWNDDSPGNEEIHFKKSGDGGANWDANQRLTNNSGYSGAPSIAVSGLNVYLVWYDDSTGNYEIYFKRSADGGASWNANKLITNNSGPSQLPALAVSGSNVCAVWIDYSPGNYEIYFKQSSESGASWGAITRLTNNSEPSWDPDIALNSANVFVAWYDNSPGNYEIFLAFSPL